MQRTAGRFKRTINVLTPNTEEGVAAFEKELEVIHSEFKQTVVAQRPALAATVDDVATGEAWLAVNALDKRLVDALGTSDGYLRARAVDAEVRHEPLRHDASLRHGAFTPPCNVFTPPAPSTRRCGCCARASASAAGSSSC